MHRATPSEFLQHLRITDMECALIDVAPGAGAAFVALKPTFHFMLEGRCHIGAEDGTFGAPLECGDFAVVSRGCRHHLSDTPGGSAVSAEHAQRARPALERDVPAMLHFGPPGPRSFRVLSGVFDYPGQTAAPIVAALPPLLLRPRVSSGPPLMDLVERSASSPGGRAFVLRLADFMLLETVLGHPDTMARVAALGPTWLRTYRIEHAVAAITANPAHRWTLEMLARHVGMSRASFAAKYAAHVGQPPMQHVASIRLRHAAGLLRSTALAINEVARQSGYGSETAFARVFRRVHGMTPAAYRRAAWIQPIETTEQRV